MLYLSCYFCGSFFLIQLSLQVTVRQQNGDEVLSQMIKVEVYRELRLHPDYIYLAPGASYVVISFSTFYHLESNYMLLCLLCFLLL